MSAKRGIDSTTYVQDKVRNNVGRSQLAKRIEELGKEERSDLRMLETSKSQFRLKFLKYEPPPPSNGSEAKDVRMFETHTPGFCYRRNGDIRCSQFSPTDVQSHCFQDVYDLLFSNNEVDIEKVLCLHLLAVHKFIKQRHSSSFYSRPEVTSLLGLDRLISNPKKSSSRATNTPTRSFLSSPIQQVKREILTKKTHVDESSTEDGHTGFSKLLPSYVIDLKRKTMMFDDIVEDTDDDYWDSISREEIEMKKLNLDEEADEYGTETERPEESVCLKVLTKNEIVKQDNNVPVHMNKQIAHLVDSVIRILQQVNPSKVQRMIHIARQPSALKKLIAKPEIQLFIEKLSGKRLMSNWDSFRVTSAKVVTIREKTSTVGELPTNMAELGGDEEDLMVVNLEIANTTISLEKLVSEIRKSILQETAKSQDVNYQEDDEEEDSIYSFPRGSWRNLYRTRSNNTLNSKRIISKTLTSQEGIPPKNEIHKEYSLKSINTINESLTINVRKTIRVSKASEVLGSRKNSSSGSGFTLASYTGFTNSKGLTSSGMLPWERMASKDTAEQDDIKNAKRMKSEDQATQALSESPKNNEGERPESRGAPNLKTNNPFTMRKVKCPVCKERLTVMPEYENTKRFVNRKCATILPTTSFNVINDIEKPFQDFKDKFLRDSFFKTRGLEDLLKAALPSTHKSLRENELSRSRHDTDSYSSRLTSAAWGMIRLNQTASSIPLTSQREQVEQLLLERMTPTERLLVFRKLSNIKSEMSTNGAANFESIPFASYVVPVMSKKSMMRLFEGVEGRVKDVICMPTTKGGLGMADYFGAANNGISNSYFKGRQSSAKSQNEDTEENKVNSHSSVLQLEKLKVDIAKKETHKKYLEFLKKKIP